MYVCLCGGARAFGAFQSMNLKSMPNILVSRAESFPISQFVASGALFTCILFKKDDDFRFLG